MNIDDHDKLFNVGRYIEFAPFSANFGLFSTSFLISEMKVKMIVVKKPSFPFSFSCSFTVLHKLKTILTDGGVLWA